MTDIKLDQKRNFHLFLAGMFFTAMASGISSLLYPWLLVGILGIDPGGTGFAMMIVMLPATFLLLWAGALSDGRHLGTLLLRLYAFYWLPHLLLLACLFWLGWSYGLILLYGLLIGVVGSFVQPARESLLGEVALPPLQSSVARTLMAQYLGMGSGAVIGGYLISYNITVVVVLQLSLFCLAGFLLFFSSPKKVVNHLPSRTSLSDITSGLSVAWNSPQLRHLFLMVGATGFMGLGFYFVLLPLLTREIYQAEASFLAGLQVSFLLGGVCCSLLVMRRVSAFSRPGRVMIYATIARGFLLILLSLDVPAFVAFACLFGWGGLSGLSTMVGRTMAQELSPVDYRARIISIYQLALFGVGPLGAVAGGLLINYFGVLETTAIIGITSIVIGGLYLLPGNVLWQMRSEAPVLK